MNASRRLMIVVVLALLSAGREGAAVTSKSVEEADFNQFSQGELQSVALSSDGYLMPTYARRELGNTGTPIVWDALRDSKGRLLCATGHKGLLVRIDARGTTSSLGSFGDSELTAMAALQDGSVLVAGAPSGRIYRLAADDTLTTAATLGATFVWRMAVDARGDVWAATGPEGRLFRMRPGRAGALDAKEVCKLRSSNLLDLWIDERGSMGKPGDIFVAGHDPGWLYRVTPSGESFEVIFNAQAEEIRAIAPAKDGLALALNTERAPTPQAINLTLRMAGGAMAGATQQQQQQPPGEGGEQNRTLAQIFAATRAGQFGPPRSEVVILDRKGFVRPLWRSAERPIHAMAASPNGTVLAAAGNDGRIFEIQEDGNYSIVVDTRDDFLVRLYRDGDGYMVTAGRNGVVYRVEDERSAEAVFLSQALDARLPVTWGQFYMHGDVTRGQRVLVSFRHGNDGDTEDGIWSEWTKDAEAAPEQPVKMPVGPARFMQYRLKLNGAGRGAEPPRADRIELFFVEPNLRPLVQNLTVEDVPPPGQPGRPPQRPQPPPGAGPGAGGPPPPGPASQGPRISENNRDPRSNTMQVKVAWQAMDPNGDPLRFDLYFRGEEKHPWLLIADEIMQNNMAIDIGGVADGLYRFRVVATDELGNPPGEALTADVVSDVVTVDNTAPVIEVLTAGGTARNGRATLRATVKDALSVLSSLKVDMDNGDAFPILPTDGMMDEREETFEWLTEPLEPGQHVATCVATDARGNSSVKKIVFTIEENR